MLEIRRYRPGDLDAVKTLHHAGLLQMGFDDALAGQAVIRDVDYDDIENVYINDRGDFLVGLVNGEIVATGALKPRTATCGEIKRIRVRQDCQRKGYATEIMRRLTERAADLGYSELFLDSLSSNLGAHRLFESCGFVKSGREMKGIFDLTYYTRTI